MLMRFYALATGKSLNLMVSTIYNFLILRSTARATACRTGLCDKPANLSTSHSRHRSAWLGVSAQRSA
jgi:hypothetical protein